MKPTEFIVENSVIAQEADHMHKDHEVQMARSQMYSAAEAAIEIHRLLKDISELEGLEGWVQSKLTLASQYLESVRDYLKYEAASEESEQLMPFAEDAANYALDNLLNESYVGRETKEGTWRVFKTGQAVAVAGPFKSAAEANAWIKKQKKEVSEGQGRNSGKTTAQGGYYVVSGARAKKFSTHKAAKAYSEKNGGDVHSAEYYHDMQQKKTVKESASAGATGAGAVAVSMSGPAGKPGTGKPKKIGNAAKMKKAQVGKGIY